jgi:hypothetical protein
MTPTGQDIACRKALELIVPTAKPLALRKADA